MLEQESGLTEGVAQQLWYFMMAVHDGRFDDAAVHDRLARAQFFEGISKQLSAMSSAVRLAAMRAMKEPPWKPGAQP